MPHPQPEPRPQSEPQSQSQSQPQSQPQSQSQPETPSPQRTRRCRHIFSAGRQCGSPCLRTEQFCYFHHTTRRPVTDPKSRAARTGVHDLPVPEDRDSIRAAIAQVMHAIAHNNIDPRRAGLLLYSLQIALCALPHEPKETRMTPQSLALAAAAARPASPRAARRKPKPVNQIPAEPMVEETVLDDTYGLIAPETFLEPEEPEQEPEDAWQDPGDRVLKGGGRLRNTLGYKLLKDVELYESRTQGWHRGRVDAFEQAAKTAAAALAAAPEQDRSPAAVQLAQSIVQTLASTAAKAVADQAAFTARVAAGMAKSAFYTGHNAAEDDEDYEDAQETPGATPDPELEPWESPILPSLDASAGPAPPAMPLAKAGCPIHRPGAPSKARVPHPSRPHRDGWDRTISPRPRPNPRCPAQTPGAPSIAASSRWVGSHTLTPPLTEARKIGGHGNPNPRPLRHRALRRFHHPIEQIRDGIGPRLGRRRPRP